MSKGIIIAILFAISACRGLRPSRDETVISKKVLIKKEVELPEQYEHPFMSFKRRPPTFWGDHDEDEESVRVEPNEDEE